MYILQSTESYWQAHTSSKQLCGLLWKIHESSLHNSAFAYQKTTHERGRERYFIIKCISLSLSFSQRLCLPPSAVSLVMVWLLNVNLAHTALSCSKSINSCNWFRTSSNHLHGSLRVNAVQTPALLLDAVEDSLLVFCYLSKRIKTANWANLVNLHVSYGGWNTPLLVSVGMMGINL